MSHKKRNMTGLLSLLEVFSKEGLVLGYGHVIYFENKVMGPYLGTITGEVMPEGRYTTYIKDDPMLIIMNETIQ